MTLSKANEKYRDIDDLRILANTGKKAHKRIKRKK